MYVFLTVNLLGGGGNIIAWLILGGIAGTVAGRVLYGHAFGFVGNIILGLMGAFVGGEIADIFINGSLQLWGSLLVAILGSIIVVWLWGTLMHKQRANS